MTDHPITPPPELVRQWVREFIYGPPTEPAESNAYIATRAAQWASDKELEACCEWMKSEGYEYKHKALFAARRPPKPPSLKEQALIVLDDAGVDAAHENILRRALEALPDD